MKIREDAYLGMSLYKITGERDFCKYDTTMEARQTELSDLMQESH